MDPRRGGISAEERQAGFEREQEDGEHARIERLRALLQTISFEHADGAIQLHQDILVELEGVENLAEKKRRKVYETVAPWEAERDGHIQELNRLLMERGGDEVDEIENTIMGQLRHYAIDGDLLDEVDSPVDAAVKEVGGADFDALEEEEE